ncbi:MAG: radical SAM protein, partial [Phycisphaerae bacterium]
CNFDCVYCCVDRTTPPTIRTVDLTVLETELDHLLAITVSGELWASPPFDATPPPLRRLNDVAFSGAGEPTSYKHFGDACQISARLLEKHHLHSPPLPSVATDPVKLVVITNATLFHRPAVRDALAYLDHHNGEIWAKLDAGTEAYYRQIERTSIPLSRVVANILDAGRPRPIVIQSLFLRLHDVGPSADEITAYVGQLNHLRAGGCQIKLVQVYTVARSTAVPECTPIPAPELDAISARVRAETGLTVETYYGPG